MNLARRTPYSSGPIGDCVVLACVVLAGGALGCTDAPGRADFAKVDSAGVMVASTSSPDAEWLIASEPSLSLGSLDSGPTEFYQIRDIDVLPDDRIAILNGGTNEIRFFSADGEFLGAAGRSGHGPGEYDGFHWLQAFGDSLLTHDWGNDRVSVLDSSGTYARSFRLEWHYGIVSPLAVRPDRTVLAFTTRHMVEMPHAGLVTDSALLSRYDSHGTLLDSVGRFAHNQRVVRRVGDHQTTLEFPFSADGQLAAMQAGFCYVFGVHSEIRCYDFDGQLTRIARLGREPVAVTAADVDAYWDRELASRNRRRVDALRRMREVMVFPDFYPAFSDLLVDDQNRLWVQDYRRPAEPRIRWNVLDEGGRWIAAVAADTAFQLELIHDDRLYGVWRDEFGVESVRVYGFSTAR